MVETTTRTYTLFARTKEEHAKFITAFLALQVEFANSVLNNALFFSHQDVALGD